MHSAFTPFLHQPSSLQGQLHPRVTKLDVMLSLQLLVKVTHVEVVVLFS